MTSEEIIKNLKNLENPKNIEGMKRFAVGGKNTLGISIPILRKMAKEIKKEFKNSPNQKHTLALELWSSGIHEAKLLAGFIDESKLVTESQMEEWVKEFDSWDICDQVLGNLFDKTPFAVDKIYKWTKNDKEFIKRAGFVLMATLSVHDKKIADSEFTKFMPIIIANSTDARNFVKKAVNWALRQIGKRNLNLNKIAIETGQEILKKYPTDKSAKFVGGNALRELKDNKILRRIK